MGNWCCRIGRDWEYRRRRARDRRRTIMPQIAPYGSWKSPITSDLIVAETIKLEQVVLDGPDIYWIERRPAEGGRYVIVRRTPDRKATDMLAAPYNARTTVHAYGGGSYTVSDGVIYFSNFSDQHLSRLTPGSVPKLIAAPNKMRYAGYDVQSRHSRIICVRDEHTPADCQPQNTLVSTAREGS